MFTSVRRLLPLLVLLLCLLVPGALADTEGNYTYYVDDTLGSAVITGYTGTAANVIVPGTLGGQPVVRMGFGCMQSNAYAVTITLPDSLRVLDGGAFIGCSSLTAVYLPGNLTTFTNCGDSGIDYYVGCSTATARLMSNPAGSFPGNRFIDPKWPDFKLYSIINETTGTAELGLYKYLGNDTVVTVPEGLVHIYGYSFENSTATTITLPDSLRVLDGGAFIGCSSLTAVNLPANLTAFTNCGDMGFRYVVGRSTATARLLTNAANSYPGNRFVDPEWPDYKLCYFTNEAAGAAELGIALYIGSNTVVTVPDGVVRIGQYAFANTTSSPICGKLTSMMLPDSVTALDREAFSGTYALKTLTLSSNISAWGDNLFGQYRNEYPILYCAADSTTARTMTVSACPQGYTDPSNPDWSWLNGGRTLTRYTGAAEHITLPDTITAISSGAFTEALQLKAIDLPDNISSWGSSLFRNTGAYPILYCAADSTTARTMTASACPQGYTDPADPNWSWAAGSGKVLTGYHGSATRLRLPDGITAIGEKAFYDNRTLTSITVPDSVRSIGANAFNVDFGSYAGNESAYGKLDVYLPDGITSAGGSLSRPERTTFHFSLDSQTADAIIAGAQGSDDYCHVVDDASPDWHWCLTKDGPYYAGYTGPEQCIDVPAVAKGVSGIAPSFPSSIPGVSIKSRFVTSIRLPEGITTIEDTAFAYQYSYLQSITLPSTLTTIGANAFNGCSSLTCLEIPEGVTSLPEGMCKSCFSLAYVTIPDSVTSIADNAFENCPLKTVYCNPGSYAENWAMSKKLTVIPPASASNRLIIPDPSTSFFAFIVGVQYDWRMNTAVVPSPEIPYTLRVSSSDPKVAAVKGDTLRFLKSGIVTLTFSCPELGLTKSAKYTVFYPIEDFSLKKAYYVKLGSAITIKPLNIVATKDELLSMYWSCGTERGHGTERSADNSLVLTADDVRWLGLGIKDVTAATPTGVTRTSKLVVYNTIGTPTFAPFTGEYYPGMTVYPHITVQFDSAVVEDDPAFYKLTSSNNQIALPTQDGGLQLLAPGKATITAALPGGATLKQTITIADVSIFILPASLTRLEDQALAGCPAAIIVLPDGCLSIGTGAFAGCKALERIEIPASVRSIADDAFAGCNLQGLTIVTPAGSYAERWAAAHGIQAQSE